jgi:hypothetical protein
LGAAMEALRKNWQNYSNLERAYALMWKIGSTPIKIRIKMWN